MEDENKVMDIFKIILTIIIIIAVIIAGFFIYRAWQTSANNNNFKNYLEKNGFKNDENNIYVKENKTAGKSITDKAFSQEYIMYRETSSYTNDNLTILSLLYTKDGNIEVVYKLEGFDHLNNFGLLYQKGIYKNGKFDCKIITNENFEIKCDLMQEEAKKFDEEVKQVLKENKIKIKYIKSGSKKSTKL